MNTRLAILLTLIAPLAAYGQTNMTIEQKMRAIIIPSIEFRQANAFDVLNFLVEATTAPDTEPDISGLSYISTNVPPTREYFTYEIEDGTPLELHPLTLEYRRVSMYDAIDQIAKECGLTYRIENGTINFYTQDGKRIIRTKHVEQVVAPYGAQGAAITDWGFDGTDSSFDPPRSAPSGEP